MSKMVIGQFYDTREGAEERIWEIRKESKGRAKFHILQNEKGYLVVSERALKDAGIIPRKAQPKYTRRNLTEDTLLV